MPRPNSAITDVCSEVRHAHVTKISKAETPLDCQLCGKRRCVGGKIGGDRCSSFPMFGINVCISHGGRVPNTRRKSQVALTMHELKRGEFWNDSVPLTDPGEALLLTASRLKYTTEAMADRLESQLKEWDEERESDQGICECCGVDSSRHTSPFNQQILETWRFSVKETGAMLAQVQKIGLAERSVRLAESQVVLIVAGLNAVFDALGLDEAQQMKARDAAVAAMYRLEQKPGLLDDEDSHVDAVVEGVVISDSANTSYLEEASGFEDVVEVFEAEVVEAPDSAKSVDPNDGYVVIKSAVEVEVDPDGASVFEASVDPEDDWLG